MPEGGEIVFRTRNHEDDRGAPADSTSWLTIEVIDTGEGMEEAVLERVFEPFFTTKPIGKGTGMGLAAAYGTVASHGGRMEIASEPGRGTEVKVILPTSDVVLETGFDEIAEKIASGYGRAMVIDDEDGVREALIDLLESLGCTTAGFDRAKKGVSFYRERWREIDLVVLDLVLPDMKGREALVLLREINPDARVLLVSGYTADDEIHELQQSSTIEFLEKPFLLADLAESLARLMRSH
jgi:CheY-like chemotaxis protein